jgi:hypothetical protein
LEFKPDSQPFAATQRNVARPVLFGVLGVIAAVALVGLGIVIGQRRPLEDKATPPPVVELKPDSPLEPKNEPLKSAEPVPPRVAQHQHPKEKPIETADPIAVERRVKSLEERAKHLPDEAMRRMYVDQLGKLIGCDDASCMGKLDELEKGIAAGSPR